MTLLALAGTDASLLWGRSLQFQIPIPERRSYVWAQVARTSQDGNDVLVQLGSLRMGWVGIIDGQTGEPRWIRQMHGIDNDMTVARIDEPTCT